MTWQQLTGSSRLFFFKLKLNAKPGNALGQGYQEILGKFLVSLGWSEVYLDLDEYCDYLNFILIDFGWLKL